MPETEGLLDHEDFFDTCNAGVPAAVTRYALARRYQVSLRIFDMRGRQVASLVNRIQAPGTCTISLGGPLISAGFYIVSFKAGAVESVQRCLLAQ
ncbi:MAG: hypothetical protein JXA71_18045 [Chitinispirillaceae bacterium]|nr:hypothetical protein [Chitinispirillaceae bacterium]